MAHQQITLTTIAATVIKGQCKLSRILPVQLHPQVCYLPAAPSPGALRDFRIVRTPRTLDHLYHERECSKNRTWVGRIHPAHQPLRPSLGSEEAYSAHSLTF